MVVRPPGFTCEKDEEKNESRSYKTVPIVLRRKQAIKSQREESLTWGIKFGFYNSSKQFLLYDHSAILLFAISLEIYLTRSQYNLCDIRGNACANSVINAFTPSAVKREYFLV
jgi:hypothetical protein